MTEKYMIAVDMDGTLLNNKGKITERTLNTLKTLLDAGHYVVPASGRAFPILPEEIKSLSGIQYAILENGAVIWDWAKKLPLFVKLMPDSMAQRILQKVREDYQKEKYVTELIAAGFVCAEANDKPLFGMGWFGKNFEEYMLSNHEYIEDIHERVDILQKAEKINLYFEQRDIAAEVRKYWGNIPGICVTTSVGGNAEFTAANVNKGTGIAYLRKHLGIDKSHIIAIGDNENDVEMFEEEGISVAMGNARDEIKKKAAHVTIDNDRDGAARFLLDFFSQHQ